MILDYYYPNDNRQGSFEEWYKGKKIVQIFQEQIGREYPDLPNYRYAVFFEESPPPKPDKEILEPSNYVRVLHDPVWEKSTAGREHRRLNDILGVLHDLPQNYHFSLVSEEISRKYQEDEKKAFFFFEKDITDWRGRIMKLVLAGINENYRTPPPNAHPLEGHGTTSNSAGGGNNDPEIPAVQGGGTGGDRNLQFTEGDWNFLMDKKEKPGVPKPVEPCPRCEGRGSRYVTPPGESIPCNECNGKGYITRRVPVEIMNGHPGPVVDPATEFVSLTADISDLEATEIGRFLERIFNGTPSGSVIVSQSDHQHVLVLRQVLGIHHLENRVNAIMDMVKNHDHHDLVMCPECAGEGGTPRGTCKACNGTGTVKNNKPGKKKPSFEESIKEVKDALPGSLPG